jgi:hypothetical protein
MDKKKKFILVFLGSGIAMFLIFYLYPAKVFDVNVTGSLNTEEVAVSMKTFLGIDQTFKNELALTGLTHERKVSGWLILIIITIGMPLMFAYRSNITKHPAKVEE